MYKVGKSKNVYRGDYHNSLGVLGECVVYLKAFPN